MIMIFFFELLKDMALTCFETLEISLANLRETIMDFLEFSAWVIFGIAGIAIASLLFYLAMYWVCCWFN